VPTIPSGIALEASLGKVNQSHQTSRMKEIFSFSRAVDPQLIDCTLFISRQEFSFKPYGKPFQQYAGCQTWVNDETERRSGERGEGNRG